MQVLSTGLGRIVPNLISRKHTNSAATGLWCLSFDFVEFFSCLVHYKLKIVLWIDWMCMWITNWDIQNENS